MREPDRRAGVTDLSRDWKNETISVGIKDTQRGGGTETERERGRETGRGPPLPIESNR